MPDQSSELTELHVAYIGTQRLGRLATVRPDGKPQCSPVSFEYNADTRTIDIGGWNMGRSQKYRNIKANPAVAFVIDDIASLDPWHVRCVEIRGTAEALTDQMPKLSWMSREVIRIHPERVLSFGLDAPAGTHDAPAPADSGAG